MRRCVNGCRLRLRESVPPHPENGGLSLAQPSVLRPTVEEAGLEQGNFVGNGGEQKREFVVREWKSRARCGVLSARTPRGGQSPCNNITEPTLETGGFAGE